MYAPSLPVLINSLKPVIIYVYILSNKWKWEDDTKYSKITFHHNLCNWQVGSIWCH
jgi:hypothetical protein